MGLTNDEILMLSTESITEEEPELTVEEISEILSGYFRSERFITSKTRLLLTEVRITRRKGVK